MRWRPLPISWVEPLAGQGFPSTVHCSREGGGPLPLSVGAGGVQGVLLKHKVSVFSRSDVGQVGATSTVAHKVSEQPAGAVQTRLFSPGPAVEGVQTQPPGGTDSSTPAPVHCAPGDKLGRAMALSVEQDVQSVKFKDSSWTTTSMVSLHPLTV